MSITQKIIARLNSDDAVLNGLSNRDASAIDNVVLFTYPAPVMSGACVGKLVINENGSIFDDTCDQEHASFDAFVADLESMMEA